MTPTFTSWEAAVAWLRMQPERKELIADAYYDDPLLAAAQRYANSVEWRAIRAYLPPAKKANALDVGAGRGIASYALAREGFAVTALEPDASELVGAGAIRQLSIEAQVPITVVEKYSEQLPFGDATFDLVFARAVLHHSGDLEATCREVFRVLRPGGKFIAVREHVLSREADLPRFLAVHPLHRLYGGENAFVLRRYVESIEHAGLKLEECLSPLQSAINFAPRTEDELRKEILSRAFRLPWLRSVASSLAALPGVWPFAFWLAGKLDRRPGRLYSFICRRPF